MKLLTLQLIRELLPDKPIIIEAGAHIGRDTVKLACMWPHATIYACEPVTALFEQLKTRCAPFPHVITLNCALSADNQSIQQMYVSSGRSTALSSLLRPIGGLATHPETRFERATITTRTVSSLVEQFNLPRINFLRLDTQGTELNVCKSAGHHIQAISLIQLEVSLIPRYEGAPTRDECESWLSAHGFSCIASSVEVHGKADLLFLR